MDELNYVANIIKILLPMCNIGVGLKCHCIEKRGADLKWKFCFMSRVVVFMILEFLSGNSKCQQKKDQQDYWHKKTLAQEVLAQENVSTYKSNVNRGAKSAQTIGVQINVSIRSLTQVQ